MKILGVDPGIARTGWGTVEVESSKLKVQSFGCVETEANLKIEKRLQIVFESIINIIKENKPDVLAI